MTTVTLTQHMENMHRGSIFLVQGHRTGPWRIEETGHRGETSLHSHSYHDPNAAYRTAAALNDRWSL